MKERNEKGSLGDGEAEERWKISSAKRHTRCSKPNFVLSNRWQMMMTTTRMVPLVHTSLSLRLCLSFHIRFLLSWCSHKPRYRSLSLPIKVTMTTRTPRLGRDDMRAWKKPRFDRATPRFISILFPASFAATRSTTEENSAIRNQQITRRSPLFTESFLCCRMVAVENRGDSDRWDERVANFEDLKRDVELFARFTTWFRYTLGWKLNY